MDAVTLTKEDLRDWIDERRTRVLTLTVREDAVLQALRELVERWDASAACPRCGHRNRRGTTMAEDDVEYRAEIDRRLAALEATAIEREANWQPLSDIVREIVKRLAADPSNRIAYSDLVEKLATPEERQARHELDAKTRTEIRRKVQEARE